MDLPEGVQQMREDSRGRRQTVLVPAHFFDDAAMQRAQERAKAAGARRQTMAVPNYVFDEEAMRKAHDRAEAEGTRRATMAVPAYLFDEAAAERTRMRREAAATRRPTVAVPAHVFDEAAMQKVHERAEVMMDRRPTTAVPSYMFREPKEPPRRTTIAVPADWFGEPSSEEPPPQEPSRQSSLFPQNFFGSFFRQSKEEPTTPPQTKPSESLEGPSVADAQHENRKTLPVDAPESDTEAAFPGPAPSQGAPVRRLSGESSTTSQVRTPDERSRSAEDAQADTSRERLCEATTSCKARPLIGTTGCVLDEVTSAVSRVSASPNRNSTISYCV